MVYFSDEVYDDGISLNYILLSVISVWENEPNWKKRRETTLRWDISSRLECVHVNTVSPWNNTPES